MKQTSKRLLSLLLAMAMVFSLVDTRVWAAETEPNELAEVMEETDAPEDKQKETPAEAQPEQKQKEVLIEEEAQTRSVTVKAPKMNAAGDTSATELSENSSDFVLQPYSYQWNGNHVHFVCRPIEDGWFAGKGWYITFSTSYLALASNDGELIKSVELNVLEGSKDLLITGSDPYSVSVSGNKVTISSLNYNNVTICSRGGTSIGGIRVNYVPLTVNKVTMAQSTATTTVDNAVALTAAVDVQNNASAYKKVKWSVDSQSVGAVKLYADEACTREIGTGGTSAMTVYAKGVKAGNAKVIATSNDDSSKSATCTVTVNQGKAGISYETASFIKTVGDTFTNPLTNTGDGSMSYASNNTDVAQVDSATGEVTIVGSGNATITATVTDTANYGYETKTASYTIQAMKKIAHAATEYDDYYDGSPHGITVNVTDPAAGATVKYGTRNGTYNSDSSPTLTNPGTLIVYYQVSAEGYTTVTGSATVKVNARLRQTINASNVTATYGDTGVKVDASVTTGDGAISYAVTSGSDVIDVDAATGEVTIKKPGTAKVGITAAETHVYDREVKEVTVTVNPLHTVPATVTATNPVYQGTEQALVSVDDSTLVGGVMQYALGTNTTTVPTTGWTTTVPTATEAKSYYVWCRVDEELGYEELEPTVVVSRMRGEYVERGYANGAVTEATRQMPPDYTGLDSNNKPDTLTDGWYVLEESLSYNKIAINGDVHLVLPDDNTLTVAAINIGSGGQLSIYSQRGDSGKLIVNDTYASINGGALYLHGGDISVTSQVNAAIGTDSFTIYGGSLFAKCTHAPTINSRTINIYGGNVNAENNYSQIFSDGKKMAIGDGTLTLGPGVGLVDPSGYTLVAPSDWEQVATERAERMKTGIGKVKGPVNYRSAAFTEAGGVTFSEHTVTQYDVPSDALICWDAGWYVVDHDTTITPASNVNVNGEVNLIICDGATLTINGYVRLDNSEDTLNIYGGAQGTGKLVVQSKTNAAIGCFWNDDTEGTLTIHGCDVTATTTGNSFHTPGIGVTDVTIYAGSITAAGAGGGAGIGSSKNKNYVGTVTIYGGSVTANGSEGGMGIGAGAGGTDTSTLTVGPGIGMIDGDDNVLAVPQSTSQTVTDRESTMKTGTPVIEPVTYMEKGEEKTCTEYERISNKTTALEDGKWYAVSRNATVSNRISVTGAAHLILCDGAELTAEQGILLGEGATLSIYGQTEGSGKLTVSTSTTGNAAIGSDNNGTAGDLKVYGGEIYASSSDDETTAIGSKNDSGSLYVAGGKLVLYSSHFRVLRVASCSLESGMAAYKGDSEHPETSKKNKMDAFDISNCMFFNHYATILPDSGGEGGGNEIVLPNANGNMEPVSYMEKDAEKACTNYTLITESSTALSDGWYVVKDRVSVPSRISISGTVCIILRDGAELVDEKGIALTEGNNLVIFGQAEGSGKLTVKHDDDYRNGGAAIGASNSGKAGNLFVYGGEIYATSESSSTPAIGCANNESGSLYVAGGKLVTANTSYGYAIRGLEEVTVESGISAYKGRNPQPESDRHNKMEEFELERADFNSPYVTILKKESQGQWIYSGSSSGMITAMWQSEDPDDHRPDQRLMITAEGGPVTGQPYPASYDAERWTLPAPAFTYYRLEDQNSPESGVKLDGAPSEKGFYYAEATVEGPDMLGVVRSFSAKKTFAVGYENIRITGATLKTRDYEPGNSTAEVTSVSFSVPGLEMGKDYVVTGTYVEDTAGADVPVTVTVKLLNNNYFLPENRYQTSMTINKLEYQGLKEISVTIGTQQSSNTSLSFPMPGRGAHVEITNDFSDKVEVTHYYNGEFGITTLVDINSNDSMQVTAHIVPDAYTAFDLTITLIPSQKRTQRISVNYPESLECNQKCGPVYPPSIWEGDGELSYEVVPGYEDLIDIDSSGTITGKKPGLAYFKLVASETNDFARTEKVMLIRVTGSAPEEKPAQTISASDVSATYGDTGVKLNASVTTGDGALSYSVKSGDAVTVDNSGNLTILKAGVAVITVTAAATENYAEATRDVTVTINTKAMTVSAENVTVTADGQPHGITVNVTEPATGAAVKYGTEEGTYNLTESPTQTAAGTLTVYYQVTADNYTTYTGSATVTVNDKLTQTISASDVSATYGDTNKSVSASVTTPAEGGGAISYAVKSGSEDYIEVNASTGALTIKKAGTATVVVTAAAVGDYAAATKEVTVTINRANSTAAAVTANNRTYDGTQKPLVTVTGTASGGTVQYALGTETEATDSYSASIPSKTDAGTYYVWYKAVGDDNHNDSDPVSVAVSIAQKEVGIKWSNTKLTYNGKSQKPSAAATGLAAGDTCTVTVTGQKTKAGSYTATAAKLGNGNYKLPKANTTGFSIAKAAQAAPAAPAVSRMTVSSITVKTVSGEEYSLDGKTWQKSGTFRNLASNTAYKVYARRKETGNLKASPASKAAAAKTREMSSKLALDSGLLVTQTGSGLNVKWGFVDEADSYEVYAQYCGQKFDKTATVTVKGNKTCSAKITRINGKALDLTGRFRVMVVAKQGDKTLAKSLKCHVVGRKNRKYTNAKGIELVKTAVTLRAGKSASVKAKIVSADAAKKQLGSSHGAELRFETTDARVASVDKNGKITAKSKGKCTVYVFTRSGQAGKITVTVK